MTHLGDLGTARPENDASFGWFGSVVRVHPDLSDLALIELVQTMVNVGDEKDGGKAMDTVAGIARALVHPDDHDGFWAQAKQNRQTMEDIVNLAGKLIGALADRPTRLPSDSSAGQQGTGPNSTGGSSSPAVRLLEGRPDLQVAVMRAEAAKVA